MVSFGLPRHFYLLLYYCFALFHKNKMNGLHLCFKTSLGQQPFIWKYAFLARSLSCKSNSLLYGRLFNWTRLKTEGKSNSDVAYRSQEKMPNENALPFLKRFDFLVFYFNITLLVSKLTFHILNSEKQTKHNNYHSMSAYNVLKQTYI